MSIFAVTYRYTDDAAGRDQFRAEHREFLNTSGWTLLSGPTADPAGALIIVTGESADAVATAMDADPFARQGLIAERSITGFDPVGGNLADTFAQYRQ